MSVILGIDLGTSSVKAMLLDSNAGVVAVETCKYEVSIPTEGYAEQNPNDWWNKTKQVLQKLDSKNKDAFSRIEAVGYSGQMHGIVLADKNGNPLRPAIIWLDQRSKKQLNQIQEKMDFIRMGECMGNRVFTGFAFPSLMWLKEHEPDILKQTQVIMLPKDFIRFKMTGKIASEATDASSTALFNISKRKWAYDVIQEFGLPDNIFPKCRESMEIAGEITAECEKECGIKAGVLAVYGSGDQQAQSIGNGVYKEGQLISNIGTGGQISTYIKEPIYDKKLRTHTFCHALDNAYTIYGAALSSGMSINWLKSNILFIDDFTMLSKMAGEIAPGADGLIYLPYLSGERTPHMNPDAKGIFFGLTLSQDRRHLVRAVMEGVAFSLRDSLTIFDELAITGESIIASGGGANSDEWLQIQADVFQKKIKVSTVNEQACLGACILAGVGTHIFPSVRETVELFVSFRDKIYIPDSENMRIYSEHYKKFRELYTANQHFMR